MAQIDIHINGRSYAVACNPGEEERLKRLSDYVDSKVGEILKSAGQPGEQRLLLMAALLIADEVFDSRALLETRAQEIRDLAKARDEALGRAAACEREGAQAIEDAAARVGEVAGRVAGA